MNARSTMTMAIIVIAGIFLIFFLKTATTLFPGAQKLSTYISADDVEGMTVVYHDLPYALNFDQQNEMIELINRSIPVNDQNPSELLAMSTKKIIVHLFNKEDVDIQLLGSKDGSVYFSSSTWIAGNNLKDVSTGDMQELINSSYDP